MYWNWKNSFPEVTFVVRNYEKYRSGTLLLADFCKWIRCPVEVGSTIPGRANESLNSEMTEFARMLNTLATGKPDSTPVAAADAFLTVSPRN